LQLNRLPQVFKAWHEEVQYTLHCHFVHDVRVNRNIIISCTDKNLNVTFCPDGAATPIRIVEEGREHIIMRDLLNVNEAPPAFFDFSTFGTYRQLA